MDDELRRESGGGSGRASDGDASIQVKHCCYVAWGQFNQYRKTSAKVFDKNITWLYIQLNCDD